jgi:hypothetical protein
MNKEDVPFLNQLLKSLEEAGKNLEQAYRKNNSESFNKSKKSIIQIQKEISAMIK